MHPADALVIGYDHRPGDGNSPSRSDTVMLLRADPNTNTISMLSFPRDLIVNGRCPDGRTYVGRINAAYSFCGPAGTLETVRSLTDLPIHYLITVNFQGFRDIVNKLGGVWMDIDRRYYNPTGGVYATINLWPGYQKLKGWQALDYVRYRHTDSDLFRLARQQLFVKAVKQAVNHNWKNPRTVPKLLGVMRNNVEIGQKQGELSGKDLPATRSSPTGCRPATSSRSRSAGSRARTSCTQTRRTSRRPSRSSSTRTSRRPRRRPPRRRGASCARRTARARGASRSSC